jgi:ParB family chromosome partitioning protein
VSRGRHSALGRGLDALIPAGQKSGEKSAAGETRKVPLSALRASSVQPRRDFAEEPLDELAASIREKGVLQPLLVRPIEGGYEVVAGERRMRAARMAGLREIPVIVRELSDQEALETAIVENLQREDLNPVEEARAYQKLLGFGQTQERIAQAVGRSRSAVANSLRLLQLPQAAVAALETGRLTPGHARAILALPDQRRAWALEKILARDLTVREAEQLGQARPRSGGGRGHAPGPYADVGAALGRQLGTRVKITGSERGKIELYYSSEEELNRLLEVLGLEI